LLDDQFRRFQRLEKRLDGEAQSCRSRHQSRHTDVFLFTLPSSKREGSKDATAGVHRGTRRAAVWPFAAGAQQSDRLRRIGMTSTRLSAAGLGMATQIVMVHARTRIFRPRLEPVFADIRTRLCWREGILPGKCLARPETGRAFLATLADF
jgi:hypothetical protein